MPELNTGVEIFRIQIIAVAGSLFIIGFIIELIRRKKLQERYALLWLVAGIVMIMLSVWRDGLDKLAHVLGVGYAPALLFLVALGFGLLMMIHFSVVISSLTERNKILAQEIALLKAELNKINDESKNESGN
ncbi:MAG TPA: DUF2304 domain-containing protein [bacterium]|nr:DUF2304 domain-containing protein [bacterium]HMW35564.1 DUF2304 domain-containing protein [bacterium]HMY34795.1 DUF2304 domain-containing protein [bacterium]HMZ03912.1 DUF2304 domain-containing protein [bacterium]HNB08603.1 DUF2304 domain-containing protein [bacterium]